MTTKVKILMTGVESRAKLEVDANNFCDEIEKKSGEVQFMNLGFSGSLLFLTIFYNIPAAIQPTEPAKKKAG